MIRLMIDCLIWLDQIQTQIIRFDVMGRNGTSTKTYRVTEGCLSESEVSSKMIHDMMTCWRQFWTFRFRLRFHFMTRRTRNICPNKKKFSHNHSWRIMAHNYGIIDGHELYWKIGDLEAWLGGANFPIPLLWVKRYDGEGTIGVSESKV